MGKFAASELIVKESWAILKSDSELMWFPILSSCLSLFATVVLAVGYFFFLLGGDIHALEGNQAGQDMTYAGLFVLYLVTFFIVNFFEAAMYVIIHGRFSGKDLGFSDGIKGAERLIENIFLWSLINATVGIVLRMIADRSKLAGAIVAWFFGAAWNILTFFSLPAIVIGEAHVTDSFKESASIIRAKWGETIIVNFGIGIVFTLIFFLGLALTIGFVVMAAMSGAPGVLVLGIIGLFFIFLIVLSVVSSTLNVIFKAALYEYAKSGTVPPGFTPAVVQGAIRSK
jgi:hypothetical protein